MKIITILSFGKISKVRGHFFQFNQLNESSVLKYTLNIKLEMKEAYQKLSIPNYPTWIFELQRITSTNSNTPAAVHPIMLSDDQVK